MIAESISQHDEKHVVPTPLSGIRLGKRRRRSIETVKKFKNGISFLIMQNVTPLSLQYGLVGDILIR
jgi:hypothetical protein